MESLQDFGVLDNIKDTLYLFFGMALGYAFWEFCERYAREQILYVNPILFVIMLVWGASGFFFLPYSQDLIIQLLCYAIPDWDIPLSMGRQSDLFQHRSWLFSSILIPLILLGIAILSAVFRLRLVLSSLRNIAIGLLVGISAHLLGDLLLQWIPIGDTDIKIYELDSLHSRVWLFLNLVFGLVLPFSVIRIQKIR
ncbi:hypothetical protein H6F68_28085 [Trichocoleus sp. FACHB-262]|nr:hypothetical protein [Trichocoleus sp. FACHB-262]